MDDLNIAARIDYILGSQSEKINGGSIIDNCNERCIYDVTYTNDYVIKDFKKRFEKVFKDNNCYKYNELSNDMKRLANDITNDKIQEALERLEN